MSGYWSMALLALLARSSILSVDGDLKGSYMLQVGETTCIEGTFDREKGTVTERVTCEEGGPVVSAPLALFWNNPYTITPDSMDDYKQFVNSVKAECEVEFVEGSMKTFYYHEDKNTVQARYNTKEVLMTPGHCP